VCSSDLPKTPKPQNPGRVIEWMNYRIALCQLNSAEARKSKLNFLYFVVAVWAFCLAFINYLVAIATFFQSHKANVTVFIRRSHQYFPAKVTNRFIIFSWTRFSPLKLFLYKITFGAFSFRAIEQILLAFLAYCELPILIGQSQKYCLIGTWSTLVWRFNWWFCGSICFRIALQTPIAILWIVIIFASWALLERAILLLTL